MSNIPSREFRKVLRHFERELAVQNNSNCCCGVTVTQCHALMELDMKDNLTLGELAARLNLDNSTVSRTVESLVRKELIDRKIPPRNRRTTIISLTDKGKSVCNSINEGNDEYYNKILSSFPEDKRTSFIDFFELFVRAMIEENNN